MENHKRHGLNASSRIITPIVKCILSMLCDIDARELCRIPMSGPLIIVMNHVNFLEVPLMYAFLYPRNAIGIAKRETWKNPLLAMIANSWNAIPIDREGADLSAMRLALEVLDQGGILVLAPEGTRSGHGRLQKGRSGVVQMALKSGATILPVAHSGGERFWVNLRSLRRTRFSIRVGEPFRLVTPGRTGETENSNGMMAGVPKSVRAEMTDAIMNRISMLLPERQRGVYPDPQMAPARVIEIVD